MTSRVREYFGALPPITCGLLIINVSIHAIMFLGSYPVWEFSFIPELIVKGNQWYRVVTSAFIHGGIFHILMNMMSLVALGGILEPAYGSIRFLWISLLSIFCSGGLALLMLWLCASLLDPSYWLVNSVGYSGVLFSYAVIEAFHSPSPSRSVFGIFSVPTKWYPFVLLLVLQFILPNISFSGHLGGMLAGMLIISSVGFFLMPSPERFERLEGCVIPGAVRRLNAYCPVTTQSLLHPSFTFDSRLGCCQLLSPVVGIVWTLLTFVMNVVLSVLAIVGVPVDSMQQSCGRLGEGISARWMAMWDYLRSFFSSPSAYEALPVESEVRLGTVAPMAVAIPVPTPSAPPQVEAEREDLERGGPFNPLHEGEDAKAARAREVAHARAMAAAAAIQRAGQSVVARTGSRNNSRNSSPSNAVSNGITHGAYGGVPNGPEQGKGKAGHP